MPDLLIPLARDVFHIVGNTATLIERPALQSGGIVKTVRGEVGLHTSFTQEAKPTKAVEHLILMSDVGSFRIKLGNALAQTFTAGDVSVANNTAEITAHKLLTGDGPFRLSSTFQVPGGLHPQAASEVLDATGGNFANTETVVIDAKTYTFQTTLTDSDGNVQIGGDADESLANLVAAITLGAGSGTAYAASTTLHPTVTAVNNGDDTMTAYAKTEGTAGNSIAIAETSTNVDWTGAALFLSGGTAAVDYWVRKVSDDLIQFATSRANAFTGTVIDITSAGVGTITLDGTQNLAIAPAASVLDGSGAILLPQGQSLVVPAHSPLTVLGADASAILTFFWS